MQQLALVIRPDGSVPIDLEHPHRDRILQALHEQGHDLEHHSECDHHRGHVCSCSPKIKGWNADQGHH